MKRSANYWGCPRFEILEKGDKTMEEYIVKNFEKFLIKKDAASEGLIISGYGAVYKNTDLQKDRILPHSLSWKEEELPAMFYNHNPNRKCGTWLKIDSHEYGLYLEGVVTDPAIISMIKKDLISGLSIGFYIVNSKYIEIEGQRIRIIEKGKLIEVSLVKYAANPRAGFSEIYNDVNQQSRPGRR